VIFTMDCLPAATRLAPEGPANWELSLRSIDGYCTSLLNAGYQVTLFLTPWCADAHAPLVEELSERRVELGLYVQPQSLEGGDYRRYLGQYDRETQREVVQRALRRFQDVVGERPVSCRSDRFSASDETFPVLHELGFRQGSLSSPGRHVVKHAADWIGAECDAHYVDRTCRLHQGDVPFLEIPVTTDASQIRGGLSPDLAIENGTLEEWHRPLIEGQLQRMGAKGVAFKSLCFFTRNRFAYQGSDNQLAGVLSAIVSYLDSLNERYEVIPVTLSAAHARFRSLL
jgi:hypothetical protein